MTDKKLSAAEVESFELAMDEQSHAEYRAAATAKAFDPDAPTEIWRAGYIAGVNRVRAALSHQPECSCWKPAAGEYDRAIHGNPDAKAWADFFVATFPNLADKHDLMIGWFANAMMAMHDFLKRQQPECGKAQSPDAGALIEAQSSKADLVKSINAAISTVIVPATMTPSRAEYYKAGARHVIAKVNEALAAYRAQGKGVEG